MAVVKLEVRIEELVLRGFGAGMQHEIRTVMERELAALLRSGVPAASLRRPREVAHVDAGSLHVASTATAAAIGVQLAQSVYRGIAG